jgi:molecular chaperone DnaJ
MPEADLYAVLGITRRASQEEIKKAYRDIARKFHPDKNPGNQEAESIFKTAAEAYRVLGDADLRAQYDKFGRASYAPPPRGDAPAETPTDLFNEIFGSRPRTSERPRPSARSAPADGARVRPRRGTAERGSDLRYKLELEFQDAAFGTEREIAVGRLARCAVCGGTGAKAGSAPILCQTCGGAGNVRDNQGFFSVARTCPHCGGTGKLIPESCTECQGRGELRAEQTLTVTVPAGVTSGTRLKLAGEGDPSPNGGARGDLYVVVDVKPHPLFHREEDDVVSEVPIRFGQAALGATIEVPTLDGKVRMRVPPGSQSGRVFRLKGKGIPSPSGHGRGDQRVKIVVEVPSERSGALRDALERADEIAERDGTSGKEFKALMERYFGR